MASRHTNKKGAATGSTFFAKPKAAQPEVAPCVPIVPDVPIVPEPVPLFHIAFNNQWLQLWMPLTWTTDRSLALASERPSTYGMILALARRRHIVATMHLTTEEVTFSPPQEDEATQAAEATE